MDTVLPPITVGRKTSINENFLKAFTPTLTPQGKEK
jgi:hypothetical protein